MIASVCTRIHFPASSLLPLSKSQIEQKKNWKIAIIGASFSMASMWNNRTVFYQKNKKNMFRLNRYELLSLPVPYFLLPRSDSS